MQLSCTPSSATTPTIPTTRSPHEAAATAAVHGDGTDSRRVRAVAIVGSREAFDEARVFAHDLAFELAQRRRHRRVGRRDRDRRGCTPRRARRPAARRGWCARPARTGSRPPEHRRLFEEIARSPNGRLIWPFDDDADGGDQNLPRRATGSSSRSPRPSSSSRRAPVRLAERVHLGARARASRSGWCRRRRGDDWASRFAGSTEVLAQEPAGQHARLRELSCFEALGLAPPPATRRRSKAPLLVSRSARNFCRSGRLLRSPSWSDGGNRNIFSDFRPYLEHIEILAEKAALPIGPASTALLTLTLKDVVVEGPDGFFRRKLAS